METPPVISSAASRAAQLADGSWVIGVEVQASPSDINKGVDWIGAYAPSRNDGVGCDRFRNGGLL